MDGFSWGAGGEEKAPGHGQQGRSLYDTRFQTVPFCYILYVEQWGLAAACLQAITKGVLDPRLPWAERALLGLRQP